MFYRCSSALKGCFEEWLAWPNEEYPIVPMTTCSQFLYAITTLGRWVRLVGPPRPTGLKGTAGVYAAPGDPGVRAETTNFRVRGEGPLGPDVQPSPLAKLQLRNSADQSIPAVVAALRQQLQLQEGLALDVAGIFKTALSKFEQ